MVARLVYNLVQWLRPRWKMVRGVLSVATAVGGVALLAVVHQAGHWVGMRSATMSAHELMELDRAVNLGLGIAIGLAIRYAAPGERKREIVVESPFGKFNWSVLSLPFLWPLFKSARDKSEDVMRNGVKRLKKMDVERYAKPIRKRWRAWTR